MQRTTDYGFLSTVDIAQNNPYTGFSDDTLMDGVKIVNPENYNTTYEVNLLYMARNCTHNISAIWRAKQYLYKYNPIQPAWDKCHMALDEKLQVINISWKKRISLFKWLISLKVTQY